MLLLFMTRHGDSQSTLSSFCQRRSQAVPKRQSDLLIDRFGITNNIHLGKTPDRSHFYLDLYPVAGLNASTEDELLLPMLMLSKGTVKTPIEASTHYTYFPNALLGGYDIFMEAKLPLPDPSMAGSESASVALAIHNNRVHEHRQNQMIVPPLLR